MKQTLAIIGALATANGLLWMGQGSGYIPWPAESFMIGESQWVYYGGGTALAGLLLIIFAIRR